jgi:hypothetical protein
MTHPHHKCRDLTREAAQELKRRLDGVIRFMDAIPWRNARNRELCKRQIDELLGCDVWIQLLATQLEILMALLDPITQATTDLKASVDALIAALPAPGTSATPEQVKAAADAITAVNDSVKAATATLTTPTV